MNPGASAVDDQDTSTEVLALSQNGPLDEYVTFGREEVNVKLQLAQTDSDGAAPELPTAKDGEPGELEVPTRLILFRLSV